MFLAPPLLAAYWLGARAGAAAGALATALFVLARVVDPEAEVPPAFSVALRLLVFSGAGYLFGLLVEQRRRLRSDVGRQERELAELRVLRDVLTPAEVPQHPTLELATAFVPAEHGVAGDFYLVAEGPAEATVVVIGDVAGKGPEAARRAAYVRAALATFAGFSDSPARLLEMANHSLIERAGVSSTFVTAACVVIRADATISWSLAGHPPPLWLDVAEPMDGGRPGLPLGMELDVDCGVASSRLAAGQGLLLFSDGLLEARAATQALFGIDRVRELLRKLRGAPAARIVDELQAAARAFSGGELADDLCIVALRAAAPHAPGSLRRR